MILLLNGKNQEKQYKILERIGSGGFGIVYKAHDVVADKTVAVKVFKNDGTLTDEDALLAWEREAQQALSVKDKNVIDTFEFEKSVSEDGENLSYLIMEYAENGNLRRVIDEQKHKNELLDENLLISVFNQLLQGLKAIHQTTLHRDIKPENMLFSGEVLKISDFGLAKYIDQATRTRTYKGWGTYKYMAPESWILGNITPATDIYSLGIVFYELATLQLPFSSADTKELEELHKFGERPRARSINSHVSTKLDGIIYKMIMQAASQRYQSVAEILHVMQLPGSQSNLHPALQTAVVTAQKIHTRESAEELAKRKKFEYDQERIKMNRVQIKELIRTIHQILEPFNQAAPERKLTLSMGSDEDYRIIWGTTDLIDIHIEPFLGEMRLAQTGETITSIARVSFRVPAMRDEGTNFVLSISGSDDYGIWKVMDAKKSVFFGLQEPVYPLVADKNLLQYFHKSIGIGEYGYQIRTGIEEELAATIKKAFELYENKDKHQFRTDFFPRIIDEDDGFGY